MYSIGIDLGGTNIAAGIVNENYQLIRKDSVPTQVELGADVIIENMATVCRKVVQDAGLTFEDIAFAGIAAPGVANRATGEVECSANLPFVNFPIVKKLKEKLPLKNVYLENDANAAALGEAVAGASKGTNCSVMITLGTGVGGGIIIDKKVYSGFNFAGAELGHIVIEYNGRPCGCGRKGCWEAYSSATGLINMTKEAMQAHPDSKLWELAGGDLHKVSGKSAFAAMRQGDPYAKDVVKMYIEYLACGIANIINIFQPEILCIGGGVCNEGDPLLLPMLELVDREQYTRDSKNKTHIRIAELGNDAGIIGAAALGM